MQLLIVLSTVFWALSHARYYIIDPISTTVWYVNSFAAVRWNITSGPVASSKLTVDLMAGLDANLQRVTTICDNLPPTATSCNWAKVPEYLPTRNYSIKIGYDDTQDFSTWFRIVGGFEADPNEIPREPSPTQCIGTCDQPVDNNPSARGTDQRSVLDPGSGERVTGGLLALILVPLVLMAN